jgi:hypothetical protein
MIHLSGITLPASYLAEFASSESGTAEQITQTTDTVTVPDKYLTSGNPVYVWIVVVGQDERTTRYEIIVPVRGRGEPDDYTPTPSEQTAIEAAIAALNEAVTAAGVAIEHYPRITDGVWQVWDVTAGEWISTEVGATGNGIAGATLNQDYTLTLTFTNGTSYTTPSIRGAQGPKGDKGDKGDNGAQGPKGDTGATGPQGPKGDTGATGSTGPQGETGPVGAPGVGVPTGGTTGQVLSKVSGTDYDTEWTTLNPVVTVSGTTPSITGLAGLRYVCGEVSTLTIVAPESGCIDVTFTSGSTATVLTVSSAKTGVTAIKWANGFDPTSLEANTVYEINIIDGEFGVMGSWT